MSRKEKIGGGVELYVIKRLDYKVVENVTEVRVDDISEWSTVEIEKCSCLVYLWNHHVWL